LFSLSKTVTLAGLSSVLLIAPSLTGCASDQSSQSAGTSKRAVMVASRRLTETEYRHTVADTFGDDIKINGRFEPDKREEGLLAVGSAPLSVSAAGFEQYYAMAKAVSDQVFDDKHKARFATCQPADPKAADDKCTAEFIRTYGEKLFRRPLSAADVAARVALAKHGATDKGDYYAGMKLALTSLLTAPEFTFRLEMAEPDPSHHGQMRLDSFTRAERLSYLMWDSSPDAELMAAAKGGELQTPAGIEKQVDRLAASPRMQDGARAFFTDMLELDGFGSLTKDSTIYPKFSQAVADSSEEQTLRTMVDLLIVKNSDYRDIFTSRSTFINRSLASVYQVPLVSPKADWVAYTFPEGSDRAGIQTEATFLSLFSHPGRSSPTKRGVALNEIFLCTETPPPPANVDFSIVNNTANPDLKTVRDRLLAHAFDDTCAGCHNLSDPIGLSLERFDSIGQQRMTENGVPIDVRADLKGVKFTGASGLGGYLRNEPRVPACIVRKVYSYGVGHAPDAADKTYLDAQVKAFAADGYKVPDLIKRVATSPEYFKVVMPKPGDVKLKPAEKKTPGKSDPKKPGQVAAQQSKRSAGDL
jgi:hypothetical protein